MDLADTVITCLDDVVCHRQNSASAIQGLLFSCSACPVWPGPTLAPLAVCLVYGRNRLNRCSARAQVPSVCRRLPNLRRHVSSAVHSAIDQLSRCLHDVDVWMSASRLRLNASKTQVLWLGVRHNIDRLTVHGVLSSTVGVVGSARDLGVVIDSRLSMVDHVASVCCSAYYHLRQIRPTLQSLSRDAAKTLVQAFISRGLDYCNLVRRYRHLISTTAVCTERCRQVNHADGSP